MKYFDVEDAVNRYEIQEDYDRYVGNVFQQVKFEQDMEFEAKLDQMSQETI